MSVLNEEKTIELTVEELIVLQSKLETAVEDEYALTDGCSSVTRKVLLANIARYKTILDKIYKVLND